MASPTDDPLALQMAVRVEKNSPPVLDDVLAASALAVIDLLDDPRSATGGEWHRAVGAWNGARIRKLVRRARGAAWERCQGVPGVTVAVGTATVRAFVPGPMSEAPPEVAKLQIQTVPLPDDAPESVDPRPGDLTIVLDPDVSMSWGKQAAQVAHAGQRLWQTAAPDRRERWRTDGSPVTVLRPDPDAWSGARARAEVEIRDGGFTEVARGTLTAVAFWSANAVESTLPLSVPPRSVSPMDMVIEANGLRRSFGEVEAVRGVDLSVSPGEIYGFLGPNGAGKSTVVKMLTTLLAPTGGSANVLGMDVLRQAHDIRLRIGAALQDASLDDKQTGREILRVQGSLYGLTRPEIDQRIDELSTLIEFDAIDRFVATYSGGMKRRLDLAASLMHNPDLLFLDEPTTGLDPTSRARVWEEVRALNDELGTTIFLTTQYLEEADELADRVGIINAGEIVGEGTPDELKRSVGADVIQVGLAGDPTEAIAALERIEGVDHIDRGPKGILVSVSNGAAAVSPVAVALDSVGVAVDGLTLRTPTLDDVFLELTGDRIEVSE